MNISSKAGFDSPIDSPGIPPAPLSPTRPLYWSIRRELWENPSIFVAPLLVGAFVVFGFMISTIGMPQRRRAVLLLNEAQQRAVIAQPFNFAALLIMFVAMIVGAFYCLDAFHGERRDRSILFWKSLPVSDFTTVLSKASVPFVVLPLVTFAVAVTTQILMLLWSSAILLPSGLAATTWTRLDGLQGSLLMLYHLLAVHALWWAPFWGWLLLISAWARRGAFLWAVLPPLAIGIVERITFDTSHFANLLKRRFLGGPENLMAGHNHMSMSPMATASPGQFLASPGFWIGLAFAAACLAAAARLRRYREPI